MLFQTMSQLGDTLKNIVDISNGNLAIIDAQRIRGPLIDRLTTTARFHEKVEMRGMARWIIKRMAAPLGIHLKMKPENDISAALSTPSIQITGMCYDSARMIFHSAAQHHLKTLLTPYSPAEQGERHPSQYESTLIAAAIQAGFQGTLLFQEQPQAEPFDIEIYTVLEHAHEVRMEPIELSSNITPADFDIGAKETLKITIRVFGGEAVSIEKQEAFLWALPSALYEKISLALGEKLGLYFKKIKGLRGPPQIQEKITSQERSFTLRDEIAAALTEPETDPSQAFFEMMAGLKRAP